MGNHAIESMGFVFVGVVGLSDPFDLAASEEQDSGEVFSSVRFLMWQGICSLSILSNCSFCAFNSAISASKLSFDAFTLSDSCASKQMEKEVSVIFP